MNRVRRLAVATTVAVFLLISIGGFVRASGAGLGCPDWPKCFGRWWPPTSLEEVPLELRVHFNLTKAWIEYVNRVVGVIIGFLIFGTFVSSLRHARGVPGIVRPVGGALVLVAFQGFLGGQVVKKELDPRFVTVHLVVALVIAALLIYATLNTWSERLPPRTAPLGRTGGRLRVVVNASLLLGTVQVVLGALVRGGLEIVAKKDPELPRAEWIHRVGLVDEIHRNLSIWIAALVILSWWWARAVDLPHRRLLHRVAGINVGLVIAQIGAGLSLAYAGLPPTFQLIHLSVGVWLIASIFILALLLRRTRSLPA